MSSSTGHGKAREKESDNSVPPEIIPAAVSLALAALNPTLRGGTSSALGLVVGLGVPVSTSALVASFLRSRGRPRNRTTQFLITATATWTVICLTSTLLLLVPALPGIMARYDYRRATPVVVLRPARSAFAATSPTALARGLAAFADGTYAILNLSDQAGTVTWFDTPALTRNFYAEVTASQVSGSSTTTACALAFGRTTSAQWYELDLSSAGAELVQTDSSGAIRTLDGPLPLPFATDVSHAHRLAVLRIGGHVTLFVDDHRVTSQPLDPTSTSGAVTFGTRNEGPYRADAECVFTSIRVRQHP